MDHSSHGIEAPQDQEGKEEKDDSDKDDKDDNDKDDNGDNDLNEGKDERWREERQHFRHSHKSRETNTQYERQKETDTHDERVMREGSKPKHMTSAR